MQRLKICNIFEGKGASKAGLQAGDVIETFVGRTITSNDDLSAAIERAPTGGELVVYRGTEYIPLSVTDLPLGINTVSFDFQAEIYDPDVPLETMAVQKRDREIDAIIVTTTPQIEGYRVAKVVDVISAECVFGMNILKDAIAALSDFVGGRSGTSQNTLREARQTCIYELKAEAHKVGANAVIGVALAYSEFSSQGKSMLFLVASGTAVLINESYSTNSR